MLDRIADLLGEAARKFGTPSYVYYAPEIRKRLRQLDELFGPEFNVSYAAKANPNTEILSLLERMDIGLDVSSFGEMERGLKAGFSPTNIGFTGPGKRTFELASAIHHGVGEIICESVDEIDDINRISMESGVRQRILLRVNPMTVPRKFGLQMGGQASQFGIDEEDLSGLLQNLDKWPFVQFSGFHAYSAGNSLAVEAIIENLVSLARLFSSLSADHNLTPEKFIFGSGFGIPYFEGDKDLDIELIANEVVPVVKELRRNERLRQTRFGLEMGRWLVGSAGFMLTTVVRSKSSRGREIRICDAGFNNNLSAAGMMGTVMRRDWRFININADSDSQQKIDYLIVGPLCASFDVLGSNVSLPRTESGDVLAICTSGAYGLTASPTRFISHPEPREIMIDEVGGETIFSDITESTAENS